MLYLFNHVPMCGDKNFLDFLSSLMQVHEDYPPLKTKRPKAYELYLARPRDLTSISPRSCLSGHYCAQGIYLHERYPGLENIPHKKFSIIRDPLEAALSALQFSIARGRVEADVDVNYKYRALLMRADSFSRIFNIRHVSEIDEVLSQYFFIAPLSEIGRAGKILQNDLGKTGARIEAGSTTEIDDNLVPQDAIDAFRNAAALDYEFYERASAAFRHLAPRKAGASVRWQE